MLKNIIISVCNFYSNLVSIEYSTPIWAVLIAGSFVVLTLTLSVYLLFEHLSMYKNPEEQKFLIGVVVMVPCYAVESFISLLNPSISVDIGILRDCYESLAMYCFGRYLIACLGGDERTIAFMEREGRNSVKASLLDHGHERGIVKHPFPMSLILKPWKLGGWVLQVIKFGIVQYMIIKALTAISAVILEAFDAYCEGDFKWNCGWALLLWFTFMFSLQSLTSQWEISFPEMLQFLEIMHLLIVRWILTRLGTVNVPLSFAFHSAAQKLGVGPPSGKVLGIFLLVVVNIL